MLPEEIKQLIENIRRKKGTIAPPTELDPALEPLLIFQLNITKGKEESLLHHIRVDTPPIVRSFNDQHEKELLNILKYVRTLGLVNAYHPLDIDLLIPTVISRSLSRPQTYDRFWYACIVNIVAFRNWNGCSPYSITQPAIPRLQRVIYG